jgi:hypothetical protein
VHIRDDGNAWMTTIFDEFWDEIEAPLVATWERFVEDAEANP